MPVIDNESQQWIETLRIELDPLRVYTVLMNIARALYRLRYFVKSTIAPLRRRASRYGRNASLREWDGVS
jgi:hypothetical protein